jgi:hypothetical protein
VFECGYRTTESVGLLAQPTLFARNTLALGAEVPSWVVFRGPDGLATVADRARSVFVDQARYKDINEALDSLGHGCARCPDG